MIRALHQKARDLVTLLVVGNLVTFVISGLLIGNDLFTLGNHMAGMSLLMVALGLVRAVRVPATTDETEHRLLEAPALELEDEQRPVIVKYKLADMLYEMVRRKYDNRRISRNHMVSLGFEQRYWNLANAILVTLGIRDSKRHTYWNGKATSAQTLRYIGNNLEVDEEEGWIACRQEDGSWVKIDLRACHFI